MAATEKNHFDTALDQTHTNQFGCMRLSKNPCKIGYLLVLMNYRPAAVERFLLWAHQKHGDVIQYHWKSNIISVGNYELATLLLRHPNFQRKGTFTETVTILNPFSLVSISGPDWTRAHWLMVRAMGRLSVPNMCSIVTESVHKLTCSSVSSLDCPVDLYDFTKKATLDSMISEIFGVGVDEGERRIIHSGIDAIIGELQGLTQASSHFRVNRQRLDALVDAKLQAEYLLVATNSAHFLSNSVSLSATFPPHHASSATPDVSHVNAGCDFLRALVEHNTSNSRSPTKASQTPFSLIQLRDLVINVLLFMGTINPAEACVHALIEIFRSKWSISQRDLWIETETLIGKDDSHDRDAGFTRILRESLRLFPPVAGLSFNRRATADTVIDGWSFKKDVRLIFFFPSQNLTLCLQDNIICSPYVFHLSPKIWDEPHVFRPARFLQLSSIQSASFMPFSVGARSCPGVKIGSSVAVALLKTMLEQMDVFVPQSYVHKRSLRGGVRFYVRKSSEQSHAESRDTAIFVRQARLQFGFAHKIWYQLRDLSVNIELACSQLLPKWLVVSFEHQSKLLGLLILGIQVFFSIVLLRFFASLILQSAS